MTYSIWTEEKVLDDIVKLLVDATSGIDLFDSEEIHDNCTVQVWKNSKTGDVSIGWWEN